MANFLDREATEDGKCLTSNETVWSEAEKESDSDLSDVIPLQNLSNHSMVRSRKRQHVDSSDSGILKTDNLASRRNAPSKSKKQKKQHSEARHENDTTQETNKLVKKLLSKIKHQDSRLKVIENKPESTTTSSSSCTTPKRTLKREVPKEVRVSNKVL